MSIALAIVGFLILAVWAHLDEKRGEASSLWIAIPLVIGLVLGNPWTWATLFLPMWGLFIAMWYAISRWAKPFKFGFWDAVGIPFSLWMATELGILVMAGYGAALAFQIIFYGKLPRILVPAKIRGNIKFMPVLANAFAIGLIVHGVSWLL